MQARRPREGEPAASGIPEAPSVGGIVSVLTGRWWAVLLRGILGVVVGLMARAWPGTRRWPLVLEAVLGIGVGLVTAFYPGITVIALLALIAAWSVVGGIVEIVEAVRLRKQIEGEWLLALALRLRRVGRLVHERQASPA